MTKVQNIVGIDISKDSFDTAFENEKGYKTKKYSYNDQQINVFIRSLEPNTLCVMESTGVYHLKLAYKLFEESIDVAVVNPLSAKRFIQSSMSRSKTDKTDACWLVQYAQAMNPGLWEPQADYVIELKQLLNVQANFIKEKTATSNQIEAISNSVHKSDTAINILKNQIIYIDKQIDEIEQALEQLIQDNHRDEDLDNLKSIKGVGKKTAVVILAMVPDISKFENYKQLASFLGMCPSVCQSGTSVKYKGHICKMGNSYIRMLLYMCARSAKKYNPKCHELYDRLLLAGKAKKLALIAVANKLIKQIFAILKSKSKFIQNYQNKFAF